MKTLIATITILMAGIAFAAEPVRTWTDTQGRTLKGTLVDKDETSCVVVLENTTRVTLPYEKLSAADVEYVKAADVQNPPRLSARTVATGSKKMGASRDSKFVEVKVSNVQGRKYNLVVIWLGDSPKNSKAVAARLKVEKAIEGEDLVDTFEARYGTTKLGNKYRGWVVGLQEETDYGKVWVHKMASQQPFVRFLDE